MMDELLWRWPGTPNIEGFHSVLHAPGSEHYALIDSKTGRVSGHCGLYGFNAINRTAYFEASLVRQARNSGAVAAIVLAFERFLARFDLRKVYLETTTERLAQFRRSLEPSPFELEAVLKEHLFMNGRPEDLLIFSARAPELRSWISDTWAQRFERYTSARAVAEISDAREGAEPFRSI